MVDGAKVIFEQDDPLRRLADLVADKFLTLAGFLSMLARRVGGLTL